MSSSEIRAQKNQPPSLISSLPDEIFVDIVAPCLLILLPESLPSLHVFPITHCFPGALHETILLVAHKEMHLRRHLQGSNL
ncbi:hypothetical protein F2Q69_00001116 [Brassica cretica]|uniref:Uncharacterized protein n=1 Tax=Brassica cretica TaxID=69181 RepID=A0A8S9PC92_BRACR|nr:hypothetical protein F2Q69_00001116 [Brassica cretica]